MAKYEVTWDGNIGQGVYILNQGMKRHGHGVVPDLYAGSILQHCFLISLYKNITVGRCITRSEILEVIEEKKQSTKIQL